jgi:hypothetical protein
MHLLAGGENESILNDFLAQLPQAERDALKALVYLHENYDTNKLRAHDKSQFGPKARIWPVPKLGGVSDADFAAPTLVAIVHVEGGKAGDPVADQSYSRLRLTYGINCVAIQNQGSNWFGIVWHATGDECVVPGIPSNFAIAARRETTYSGQYPAVTRWDEGTTWLSASDPAHVQPTIGVRCGSGWCELGPNNFQSVAPAWTTIAGMPSDPEVVNRGAYDEQFVSIPKSVGKGLKPGYHAVVVTEPGIARQPESYFTTPRRVATIWFETDPAAGTKYKKKGFKGGANILNTLSIHFDSGANKWYASLNGGAEWEVERHPVGLLPPGVKLENAARWAWNDKDEDLWVPCGEGCCYASFK